MKILILLIAASAALAGCATLQPHKELTAPCAPSANLAALSSPCERTPVNLASADAVASEQL